MSHIYFKFSFQPASHDEDGPSQHHSTPSNKPNLRPKPYTDHPDAHPPPSQYQQHPSQVNPMFYQQQHPPFQGFPGQPMQTQNQMYLPDQQQITLYQVRETIKILVFAIYSSLILPGWKKLTFGSSSSIRHYFLSKFALFLFYTPHVSVFSNHP